MIEEFFWDNDTSIREFVSSLIAQNKVIPVLGSGFTRKCKSKNGNVPSGEDMSKYLKEFASKIYNKKIDEYKDTPFTDLCTYYNKRCSNDDKFKYFSDNFTEVVLSEKKINFLRLFPRRIYTLNIDDAIEYNCDEYKVILPRREIYDKYIEEYSVVFKVHGDVHFYLSNIEEEELIFNKRQYIDSIKSNTHILSKLKDDFIGNLLYIGCSLSDEPDLMSIVIDADKNKNSERKSFYVSDKSLPEEKKDLLEDYGITTCLIVRNYNTFYEDLVSLVQEKKDYAQPIDIYREPEIIMLDKNDTSLDNILKSNSVIPIPFEGKIFKPSFFAKRDIVDEVLDGLRYGKPIHIIYGHRISGKTFLLVNLLEAIKDKTRYFFPSGTKIVSQQVDKLLDECNSLFIFDTNTLDADQIYKITKMKKNLERNSNYVIMAINSSDRSGLDLLTENGFYGKSKVKNIFSDNEINRLNKTLQLNNLPTFRNKEKRRLGYQRKAVTVHRTILDNLFIIAERFRSNTDIFNISRIKRDFSKEVLALLILLGTNQTLATYDLFYFDLIKEAQELVEDFPVHFEINYYQYNLSGIDSDYKLTSNSKYFLLRYLSQYAEKQNNYQNILLAYRYIYEKISMAENDFYTTRKMLDYIKFDVLNDIFYRDNASAIELIKYLYEGLEDVMNINPQFKHQRAKSILWLCHEKIDDIKEAAKYIDLARYDVENILKKRENDKLKISLEHIKYTQASIYGRLCALSAYSDKNITEKSLHFYKEALMSDENQNEKKEIIDRKAEKYIYEDLKSLLKHFVLIETNNKELFDEATELSRELQIDLEN